MPVPETRLLSGALREEPVVYPGYSGRCPIRLLAWSWVFFCCLSSGPLLRAQGFCAFDARHGQLMEEDSFYQQSQERIEKWLFQQALQKQEEISWRNEEDILTIPVVVHVFYAPGAQEGSSSRPTLAQIQRSIERLNEGFAYRGLFQGGPFFSNAGIAGTDVGIQFQLAQKNPSGAATTAINFIATPLVNQTIDARVGGITVLDSLRRLSSWPSHRYLNIFVLPSLCDSKRSCPLGFAYPAAAHGRDYDGVYVFSRALNSEQEVLIHEVGHYLNLYHTFEGGCSETDCRTGGDRICDTPPDCYPFLCDGAIPNCLLEERQNTCHNDATIAHSPFSRDVEDLYENFMDSGFWKCFNSFTPGQRERMRQSLLQFRSSLLPVPPKKRSDSCLIRSVEILSISPCIPADDSAWAELEVRYDYAPDSGTLLVNGISFPLLTSPQRLRLPLKASDAASGIEVAFSALPTCRLRLAGLLPPRSDCSPSREQRCAGAFFLPVLRAGSCPPQGAQQWAPEAKHDVLRDWLPECTGYSGGENWFRVVVPETGELRLSALADSGAGLAVFQGCVEKPVVCTSSPNSQAAVLTLKNQRPGDTLIAVAWRGAGYSGAIELCAFLPTAPPVNDDCSGALEIPVSNPLLGEPCRETTVSWTGAWPGNLSGMDCGSGNHPDVWYRFRVPPGGRLAVSANTQEVGMAAYQNCGTALLGCWKEKSAAFVLDELKEGEMIWLQVWRTRQLDEPVQICLGIPPLPASNDDCEKALILPLATDVQCRSPLLVGNLDATPSTSLDACGHSGMVDIWYQLVVPKGGALGVSARQWSGRAKPALKAFTGCGGASLGCSREDTAEARLEWTNLSEGDTLWLALQDAEQFQSGQIALCAYALPPPVHDTCAQAIALPVAADSTGLSWQLVSQLSRSTPAANKKDCQGRARSGLWFEVEVPATGNLMFRLEPGSGQQEAGMAVYESCRTEPLACTQEGADSVLLRKREAGEKLQLLVWSSSEALRIQLFAAPNCISTTALVAPVDCAGQASGAIVLEGGSEQEGYRFFWENGMEGKEAWELLAGQYEVVVDGPYDCKEKLLIEVPEPLPLEVIPEAEQPGSHSPDGKIVLRVSGGSPPYQFRINSRAAQADSIFSSLPAGWYQLEVIDNQGCRWSDSLLLEFTTAGRAAPAGLEAFEVFPNPAGDAFQSLVRLKEPLPFRLRLFNSFGQALKEIEVPAALFQTRHWPLDDLSPGVYFLQLEIQNQVAVRRLLVSRIK